MAELLASRAADYGHGYVEAEVLTVDRFGNVQLAALAETLTKLGDQVKMFGQSFTTQKLWVSGTTHLHEHLGQLIAYARTNGVKPPWSQ